MEKKLIVGLGNIGQEFAGTRHNVGIEIVRLWLSDLKTKGYAVSNWKEDAHLRAELATVRFSEAIVYALFPTTFMNDSGIAVKAAMDFYNINISDIVLVYDDIELELGEKKVQHEGSAKGHNGVRSVFDELGTTNITRIRVGIGRPQDLIEVKDFVLQRFSSEEWKKIELLTPRVFDNLQQLVSA